jgi:hypothetical protein
MLILAGCSSGEDVASNEVHTLVEGGASNPTVAVDPSGDFLVAWVAMSSTGGDVHLARVGADGVPRGEHVRVNDLAGDADPHEQAPAQVVAGKNEEVFVLWQKTTDAPWLDFGGADLRLAKSSDGGGTFAPAITVNDNPRESPARISFHNLAVASDGTVYASWIDARVRDLVREVAYRQGANATAHEGHAEPGTEMRIAVSHDGAVTFGPSLIVDGDTCPCCRTSLALGGGGEIYVAWRKIFAGGIRDIVVARSTDGGVSFAAPRPVHRDGWEFPGCPHAGPSLAVDDSGRLHVAWYTGREGRQGLWYVFSDDRGETFSEPSPILTDAWVPPSQARLAAYGGEVWVAWDDLRQSVRRVRLARIEEGRVSDIAFEGVGQSPSVALGTRGGLLAWHDGESVRVMAFGG